MSVLFQIFETIQWLLPSSFAMQLHPGELLVDKSLDVCAIVPESATPLAHDPMDVMRKQASPESP